MDDKGKNVSRSKAKSRRHVTLPMIDWKDKITINQDVMGGKPVIKGTRVPVQVIVGSMAGGMKLEDVCKEYSVQPEQAIAALAYAEVTQRIATWITEGVPLKGFEVARRRLKEFQEYIFVTAMTSMSSQILATSLQEVYSEALRLRRMLGRPATSEDLKGATTSQIGEQWHSTIIQESQQEDAYLEGALSAFRSYSAAPQTYEYYRRTAALIFLVSTVEDVLLQTARYLVTEDPSLLGTDAIADLQEIRDPHLFNSTLEKFLKRRSAEWSDDPLRTVSKFLKTRYDVDIISHELFDEVEEIIQRRHILVHCGGFLTERYISKVKKNLRPKGTKVGGLAQIDEKYLANAITKVSLLTTLIYGGLANAILKEVSEAHSNSQDLKGKLERAIQQGRTLLNV